jgi:hypothetical protein
MTDKRPPNQGDLRPKDAIAVSVVDLRKDFGSHPKSLDRLFDAIELQTLGHQTVICLSCALAKIFLIELSCLFPKP